MGALAGSSARHLRSIAAAIALLVWPLGAAAQSGAAVSPFAIGLDYSVSPSDNGRWSSFSPRASIGLGRRTALDLMFAPEHTRDGFSQTDYLIGQVRRTFMAFGQGTIFGALGVAYSREGVDNPAFPEFFPDGTVQRTAGPAFAFGGEVAAARFLIVRGETQFIWSQAPLLRFTGGVSIPMPGLAPRQPGDSAELLVATPIAALREGQTVWVTSSSGRVLQGEVASRSRTGLTINHPGGSTTVALSEVTRIERPDSLANGFAIGAIAGGGGGAVFGAILISALCEEDTFGACGLLGGLIFGGIGAGMGGLSGAIVDSFIDGRRIVYSANAAARVSVQPVLSARRAGVQAQLRW